MATLPTYKVTIDPDYSEGEELGVEMIAFTDDPAILVKGFAFKTEAKKQSFSDNLKYRIVAPAMIPMEIYRRDDEYEYQVEFTVEEIEAIHVKMMANLNKAHLFNLEHDTEVKVPAYVLEAWLVDNPKEDKSYSTYGIEVPKGTLMITAQVTDKDYYKKLVDNDQVGFSIEGFLGLKDEQFNKHTYMKLPDGEHLIDGKVYIVVDGEVTEVKDAEEVAMESDEVEEVVMADETTEEETKEEEVEMADESEEEVKEEEVALEVDPSADTDAIVAIVTPLIEEKFNELVSLIAELKQEMMDSETVAPESVEETQLSATERFSRLNKFLRHGN